MRRKSEVKLVINTEWCKGCGICVAFCPKQVLELNCKEKAEAARIENCIACRMCERRCPDLAIEISTPQSQVKRAA